MGCLETCEKADSERCGAGRGGFVYSDTRVVPWVASLKRCSFLFMFSFFLRRIHLSGICSQRRMMEKVTKKPTRDLSDLAKGVLWLPDC